MIIAILAEETEHNGVALIGQGAYVANVEVENSHISVVNISVLPPLPLLPLLLFPVLINLVFLLPVLLLPALLIGFLLLKILIPLVPPQAKLAAGITHQLLPLQPPLPPRSVFPHQTPMPSPCVPPAAIPPIITTQTVVMALPILPEARMTPAVAICALALLLPLPHHLHLLLNLAVVLPSSSITSVWLVIPASLFILMIVKIGLAEQANPMQDVPIGAPALLSLLLLELPLQTKLLLHNQSLKT